MAKRRGLRRVHREHRHRRPGDDPRGGEEPRGRNGRRRRRRTTTQVLAGDGAITRGTTLDSAQAARRQGLCPHRGLRRGHQQLVRGDSSASERAGMARVRAAGCAQAAALRREPAPVGGLLPARATRAPASPPPRSIQGKELSYNNLNDTDAAFELVAEFDPARGRRSPSSSTPTPAASAIGADARGGLPQGAALRSGRAPSAASSRSTGRSTRRPPRRSPRSSPRWSSRRTRRRRRRRSSRRKKNLRLLTTGGLPDPRAPGVAVRSRRGRPAGAVARQRRASAAADLKVVTKRAPTERGACRPAVRLQGRQARQVERHRLREGRRHRRHRRRAR